MVRSSAHIRPCERVLLTGFYREIRGFGQRQGQGTSLQIEALQHVIILCMLQHKS
jgi:hypothetical protein